MEDVLDKVVIDEIISAINRADNDDLYNEIELALEEMDIYIY